MNGFRCNALEKFHFAIGNVRQGVLVMDQTADHDRYFQQYQFSGINPGAFESMLLDIRTLRYPLPAIFFWLQTLQSEVKADRSIRIKRWRIRNSNGFQSHYFLFGPEELQSSLVSMQVAAGAMTQVQQRVP